MAHHHSNATTRRTRLGWTLTLITTAATITLFRRAALPSPIMLGSMIGALCGAILAQTRIRPPRFTIGPSQGIVALMAAGPLVTTPLHQLASYALPTTLAIGITLLLCAACAWIITQTSSVDSSTAVMSTLAGGASAMAVLSEELGADFRYVTVVQYLRVMIVSFSLPFLLPLLIGEHVNAGTQPLVDLSPHSAINWLVVIAVITIPGWLASFTTLPAPRLLAPLAVAILIGEWQPALVANPGIVETAAFLIIGWQAGGACDRQSLVTNARRLPIAFFCIVVLMAGCGILAGILTALHFGTFTDTYLATTPGGLYIVLAIANDQESGPIVTVMQVTRMVVMVIVTAFVPRLIRAQQHHKDSAQY
ncbi:AbrB family transcriptional regulator [Corynebacterium kroppenstedtii]|uniref:AbrB family transcriptional regulator n=1 Tax=Corynebacterium sp. PCR 32 TaxID=3351342 RepID=UPI0030A2DCC5